MTATGVLYAMGALDFTARPGAATHSLNQLGGEPLEHEGPGFYNALAAAYMATIAALALSSAQDPGTRRQLVPPLLVAKAASSTGMLLRYLRTGRRGFAVGAALDALLFGVTAGLYGALDD